jgi:hypothetical protein
LLALLRRAFQTHYKSSVPWGFRYFAPWLAKTNWDSIVEGVDRKKLKLPDTIVCCCLIVFVVVVVVVVVVKF